MDTRNSGRLQVDLETINKRIEDGGVSIILACDLNYGIGIDGDMLFWIDDDLKRFKEITMGKNLYMGRSTFESTGPLEGRKMIALSSKNPEGADEVIHDLDEFRERLKNDKNGMLIGGANTVNSLIHDIKYMYLTIVLKTFKADSTLLDPIKNGFVLESESEIMIDEKTGLNYKYVVFKRK